MESQLTGLDFVAAHMAEIERGVRGLLRLQIASAWDDVWSDCLLDEVDKIERDFDPTLGKSKLSFYIYSMYRESLNYFRNEKRRTDKTMSIHMDLGDGTELAELLAANNFSENLTVALGDVVKTVIEGLTEDQKRLLGMWLEFGSFADIARMVGCVEGTVRYHIRTTLAEIRERAGKHDADG